MSSSNKFTAAELTKQCKKVKDLTVLDEFSQIIANRIREIEEAEAAARDRKTAAEAGGGDSHVINATYKTDDEPDLWTFMGDKLKRAPSARAPTKFSLTHPTSNERGELEGPVWMFSRERKRASAKSVALGASAKLSKDSFRGGKWDKNAYEPLLEDKKRWFPSAPPSRLLLAWPGPATC